MTRHHITTTSSALGDRATSSALTPPLPRGEAIAAHRYAEPTVVEVLPAWRRAAADRLV
jgi:hypothetical protein